MANMYAAVNRHASASRSGPIAKVVGMRPVAHNPAHIIRTNVGIPTSNCSGSGPDLRNPGEGLTSAASANTSGYSMIAEKICGAIRLLNTPPSIPPNETLVFVIDVVSIK